MNILFASSEFFPYSKTGGLADVAGSLPLALHGLGMRPVAFVPYYKETRKKGFPVEETGKRVSIRMGKFDVQATILKSKDAPFPVYFINQPSYFNRDFLYGEKEADYADNAERYIFFCKAVLEASIALGLSPRVAHCHDWQAGLIPAYLRTHYKNHPLLKDTASVLTIHNLAYQGNFDPHLYPLTGLEGSLFGPEGLEFYGQFSFLKAGLLFSDLLTTVSRSYRDEILEKENGCGMEGVLRKRADSLEGIINAIDCRKWDPAADPHVAAPFSPQDLQGKAACRRDLLKRFGMTSGPETPLVAMVTRLTHQKGIDLLIRSMDSLMERDLNFFLLGTGDPAMEEFFEELPLKYPGRAGVCLEFTEDLAHKIYAGADLFLMPSRFEPCGISQLMAMRYGTVPVVRSVGGLRDTVPPFDPRKDQGFGFCFDGFTGEEMLAAVDSALAEFSKKTSWKKLVKRIMMEDHSWETAAKKYRDLYERAILKKGTKKP